MGTKENKGLYKMSAEALAIAEKYKGSLAGDDSLNMQIDFIRLHQPKMTPDDLRRSVKTLAYLKKRLKGLNPILNTRLEIVG